MDGQTPSGYQRSYLSIRALAALGGAAIMATYACSLLIPSDADLGLGSSPDAGCPDGRAPAMISIGGAYCVDSTEVTNAMYASFLDASDQPTSGSLPATCAFKTTFAPTNFWPPSPPNETNYPVDFVDWCDAWAYCAWAGKRLCGHIDGGALAQTDVANASASQWFNACSHDGGRVFPYGNAFDASACNGADSAHNAQRTPVRTLPGCMGGYDGLFDMSGNVYEWEDSCATTTGSGDSCLIGGGSFETGETHLSCGAMTVISRGSTFGDVGIRCCSR